MSAQSHNESISDTHLSAIMADVTAKISNIKNSSWRSLILFSSAFAFLTGAKPQAIIGITIDCQNKAFPIVKVFFLMGAIFTLWLHCHLWHSLKPARERLKRIYVHMPNGAKDIHGNIDSIDKYDCGDFVIRIAGVAYIVILTCLFIFARM